CPVVISSAGALGEIAGEAALRVAAEDVGGFHAAMRAVLSEPSLRGDLRKRGFDRAREFSWERTARETALVYEVVSAGPGVLGCPPFYPGSAGAGDRRSPGGAGDSRSAKPAAPARLEGP
ncbi:MAG: hypothetical protein M3133_07685, partial [Actinomycetota bacterium]|nr:hypothetical protein [Actinomycetota bacterium]